MCSQCYSKQYYNDHKEEIKQKKVKYISTNRDEIKQKKAKYRSIHKEEIKLARVKHYNAHKEEIKQASKRRHYAHGGKPSSENKQCPVFLGVHVAESILSKVFKDVARMPYGHKGYDFMCNKGKKIDVKSSCTRVQKGHGDSWVFCIDKNKTADFFMCIALDNRKDINPLHLWLIPGKVVNNLMRASIAKSTIAKWDEYRLDIDKVAACCDRNGDV